MLVRELFFASGADAAYSSSVRRAKSSFLHKQSKNIIFFFLFFFFFCLREQSEQALFCSRPDLTIHTV